MSGLRFAFITTFYPPHNFGGDGIGVQRWARALARRGHHVTVICDTDVYKVLSTDPARSAVAEDSGITVHWLHSCIAPVSVLLTHQTGSPVVNAGSIRRILDAGRFDVINFHNVSALGGPGVFGMGSALKLYTAWEHWLVCPTHVLWRHNREACTGRECLRCVLAYKRPPQLWRYTGKLEREIQHIDAFIALSEFSRGKHREFGFQREMEVIPGFLPDPIAEPAFAATERATSADDDRLTGVGTRDRNAAQAIAPGPADPPIHSRPYFFFAGRLERIKGLDDVIPVFERYTDADLVIAGDGTHRAELERIAARNPRVKFLGLVSSDVVDRYNAQAIASIVPSAGFETFGFVIIEAFRRGTPVIARRIGPFPELVESCGGGELFGTPAELVVALTRMQQEPLRRAQMARAAYQGFLANWTESAVLPRYFSLLERIAVSRGRTDIARTLEKGARGVKAILTYHSIDDSGSPVSVSPEAFRRHVAWFASGVTRVVSVADLLALPDNADAIAITFDDGFRNFGLVAAPLLLGHGLPATLFVVTDAVGGTNNWGGIADTRVPTLELLNWKELATLAGAGIELGSHTRSHPHLPRLSSAAIADELTGSAERLEMETGLTPAGFAYPYGEVSDAASSLTESVYRWACTTSMRAVGPGARTHLLPRVDMYYFREPGRLETWGSARFRQYLWLRSRARQVRRGLSAVHEYL